MLTRHELDLAIECAERYPADIPTNDWGYGHLAASCTGVIFDAGEDMRKEYG